MEGKTRMPELKSKSKYLYITGNGHGALDENGVYVTPGKRSPVYDGNKILYEGVNNRVMAKMIVAGLRKNGLTATQPFRTHLDVSLDSRADTVNELSKNRKSIYIDIHSDAAQYAYIDQARTIRFNPSIHNKNVKKYYKSGEWHEAKGITTFIYTKASETSKRFAKIVHSNLMSEMYVFTRDRGIKKRNFHALRETKCPAVLLELGFHTNKEEVKLMQTDEWRETVVNMIVKACIEFENN